MPKNDKQTNAPRKFTEEIIACCPACRRVMGKSREWLEVSSKYFESHIWNKVKKIHCNYCEIARRGCDS